MKKIFGAILALALSAGLAGAQTTTFKNLVVTEGITLPSKPANQVLASPSGSAGAPTFRSLAEVDLPSLAIAKITGLQAALDAKAALAHTHAAADVTSGTFATARIPALPTSQITGLDTALAGKSPVGHTHVIADVASLQAALDAKAPLASPALTGVPTAPTATVGTNTTQIATTAFVLANGGSGGAPSNMVTTDTTQTVTGPKTFSALTTIINGTATSGSDVLTLRPSDYGAGKPYLTFLKGPTANTWNMSLWDGTGSNGTLTIGATTQNLNGTNVNVNAALAVAGATTVNSGGGLTVTGTTSTTASSPIQLKPTDYGAGKPLLSVSKDTAATGYTIGLWDGSANTGTLTLGASNVVTASTPGLTNNGNTVATTAFVNNSARFIDPIRYGAVCDGATDSLTALTNASAASTASGLPIQISCYLISSGSVTFNNDVYFQTSGKLIGANGGVTYTFNGKVSSTSMANTIVDGNSTWNAKQDVSVCWFGVCGQATDAAPYLRRMFGSNMNNKRIIFPQGNYPLCTAVAPGYNATNNSSVIIRNLQGFKIEAQEYGQATFTSCAAVAQNIAFLIDKNIDFEWHGGIFLGSRSGLATTTVNAPFQLMNNYRFTIANTFAYSGYTDAGALFEGDGNTDFIIENNIGNVGQCVDMAFSINAIYRNNRCYGVSTDGNNIGLKAFSHIYDGPIISFSQTNNTVSSNVQVINNRFENYISGVVIQEGQHWKVHDNNLINIKGLGSSPGTPVLINYQPSGSFANVGHTPWDITIQGNHVDGMGTTVAGCFVNIGANAIANGDVFNDIFIDGNMIAGAAGSTGVCADTTSSAKIANLFVGINAYRNIGALMNANASSIAKPAGLAR